MLNLDSSQTNALIVMSCAYKEIVYFHGILEPYQPEQYSLRLGSRPGLPVSWTHGFTRPTGRTPAVCIDPADGHQWAL